MKSGKRSLLGCIGISRFLQWRFNTYLMWLLPLSWMQAYIGLLGKIYFYFNQKESRIIRQNIQLVFGRHETDETVKRVIQRTFKGIFTHYAEKLFMAYPKFKRTCFFLNRRVSLENRDLLDEALAKGNGAIVVTGHYGAVEFLPLVLALHGYTVTMLLRFKTEKLKQALVQRSVGVPITLVDVNEGRGVLFEALKALKSNQVIITECDEFEEWRPSKHQRNRFLNRDVPFDRTIDMLQKRSKSPAVMGIVQRQSGGRYKLGLHALNGQNKRKKVSVSQKALEILERYILDAPYQWYQWKEASHILHSEILEEPGPIHTTEEDRHLPLEDTPVHAF
jgi:lauroyl/myristoyl acyltransferase